MRQLPRPPSHPSRVRGLKRKKSRRCRLRRRSHPSRVRGLKQSMDMGYLYPTGVAPLAGAWIETDLSSRVFPKQTVAPLAGAWIETLFVPDTLHRLGVAPLVGAWIETTCTCCPVPTIQPSHPSQVTGKVQNIYLMETVVRRYRAGTRMPGFFVDRIPAFCPVSVDDRCR